MKIALINRQFDGVVGGVERMILAVAESLERLNHDVTVISLDSKGAKAFYPWPNRVDWVKIGIGDPDRKASFSERLARLKTLRRIVKRSEIEVVVGFQIGSFALARVALFGLGVSCVAAERNSPQLFDYVGYGRVKRLLSWIFLATSDAVFVQFPSFLRYYPSYLHKRMYITPNFVSRIIDGNEQELIRSEVSLPLRLLYVGRVTFQKNLQVLVKAIHLAGKNFELTVVGDGDELEEVRQLAVHLGVDLKCVPFVNDVSKYYQEADVFCLTSRWEGFPNVVAEAMSHGLPVLGFRGCLGLRDLVTHGVNGWLVDGAEDAQSLASGLISVSQMTFDPHASIQAMLQYSRKRFAHAWQEAILRSAS